MCSTSSVASAGSASASSEPACEQSPSARSTHSAASSSPGTGPASRSSMTSANSAQQLSLPLASEPSTSSPEAFHARTYPLPAHALDLMARAPGYGASTPVSLARYDRASSSWRTWLVSFLETAADGSAEFSGTWPRSGTMRSGIAYRLPPLAPLTFGIACGLLPTVTAQTYGSTNNGTRGDGTTFNTAGTPSLDTMARRGLIPTPTAGDAKSSGSRNLEGSKAPRKMVPTPQAHDHRSGKGFDPSGRGHSPQLRHLTGGLLNPAWVLWLMGFPAGHLQSALSAMRSSRRSPKRSGGQS